MRDYSIKKQGQHLPSSLIYMHLLSAIMSQFNYALHPQYAIYRADIEF